MIAFEFAPAKMRQKLAIYRLILCGSIALMLLLFDGSLYYLDEESWVHYVVIVLVLVMGVETSIYAQRLGVLWRSFKRRRNALVVNHSGIVDNASDYALGQIEWAEIETIYPWDRTLQWFRGHWKNFPIVDRQRGIVVWLKEGVDLQTRLQDKPWLVRNSFKEQFKKRNKVWLFIPETLLDTPADEVMERLNEFYVAQVRSS